jgi:hypothetical protein
MHSLVSVCSQDMQKEEEETVLVAATSVGAATMREARQCGSESAATKQRRCRLGLHLGFGDSGLGSGVSRWRMLGVGTGSTARLSQ